MSEREELVAYLEKIKSIREDLLAYLSEIDVELYKTRKRIAEIPKCHHFSEVWVNDRTQVLCLDCGKVR